MQRFLSIGAAAPTSGLLLIATVLLASAAGHRTRSDSTLLAATNDPDATVTNLESVSNIEEPPAIVQIEPAPQPQLQPPEPPAKPAPKVKRPAPAAAKLPIYRTVRMEVTAYCPCPICCGRWSGLGKTASGTNLFANNGRFVAAAPSMPFGTKVAIPGYNAGKPVPVLDRGGAIQGNKLDLFMPTHQQALEWGRRIVNVRVFAPQK